MAQSIYIVKWPITEALMACWVKHPLDSIASIIEIGNLY